MSGYSTSWQSGGMASSSFPRNSTSFRPGVIEDDSQKVNVMHIASLSENTGKSGEELRMLDYKRYKESNRNPGISNPNPFGTNSVTPPRASQYSQRSYSNYADSRAWTPGPSTNTLQGHNAFNSSSTPISQQANPYAPRSDNFASNPFNRPATSPLGPSTNNTFTQPGSFVTAASLVSQNRPGSSNPFPSNTPNPFAPNRSGQSANTATSQNFGTTPNPFAPTTSYSGNTSNNFGTQNNAYLPSTSGYNPLSGSNTQNYGSGNTRTATNPFAGDGSFSMGQSTPFQNTGSFPSSTHTPGFQNTTQSNPFAPIGGNNFGSTAQSNPFSQGMGANRSGYPTNIGQYSSNTYSNPSIFNQNFTQTPGSNPFANVQPLGFSTNPYQSANPYASNPYPPAFNGLSEHSTMNMNFSNTSAMHHSGGPAHNSYSNRNIVNPPSIVAAFKDPQGLSWVYPDQDPEQLLKFYKEKQSLAPPEGVIRRIINNKKSVGFPEVVKNKFEAQFTLPKPTPRLNQNPKPAPNLNPSPRPNPFLSENLSNSKKHHGDHSTYENKFTSFTFEKPSNNKPKWLKVRENFISPQIQEITINIKATDKITPPLSIKIEPSVLISELKSEIRSCLKLSQNFEILHCGKPLKDIDTILSAGITDKSELSLQFISAVRYPTKEILPQIGSFKITPSLTELAKMDMEQLRTVQNFTVENEFGKIQFEGETDVIGLDLEKCVRIESKNIYGYPKSEENSSEMDQRLNKPAVVTLYNYKPSSSKGKVEVKLRISCGENDAEFLKYNEVTGEFVFRIKHL